jgi:hypothetical protein
METKVPKSYLTLVLHLKVVKQQQTFWISSLTRSNLLALAFLSFLSPFFILFKIFVFLRRKVGVLRGRRERQISSQVENALSHSLSRCFSIPAMFPLF